MGFLRQNGSTARRTAAQKKYYYSRRGIDPRLAARRMCPLSSRPLVACRVKGREAPLPQVSSRRRRCNMGGLAVQLRERERSSSFSRHLNPSVVSPGWPSRPHSCRRAHHPRLQRRRRVLLVVACAVRPRKLDGTSTIIPPTTSYDDNGVTVGRPTRSVYGPYLIRFLVQVEVRPP